MGLRSPQETLNKQPQNVAQMPERDAYTLNIDKSLLEQVTKTVDSQLNAELKSRKAAADKQKKAMDDLAIARLENEIDSKAVEAEQNILGAKGINAFEVAEKQTTNLRKQANDLVTEQFRNNPELKIRAQIAAENRVAKTSKSGITHSFSESRKLKEDTFNTRVANDIEDAAMDSTDIVSFIQEGLPKVVQSADARFSSKYGLDDEKEVNGIKVGELRKLEHEAIVSSTILKAVEYNVASGNLKQADTYLNSLKSKLSVDDLKKAQGALSKGKDNLTFDRAMTISRDARNKYSTDDVAAADYIRANSENGSVFKQSMSMYAAEGKLLEDQQKKDFIKNKSDVFSKYLNQGVIDRDALKRFNSVERNKILDELQKVDRGADQVTDNELFNFYATQTANMTDEELAKQTQFNGIVPNLSPSDTNFFRSMHLSALKRLQGKTTDANDYNPSAFNTALEQLILDQELKRSDSKVVKRNLFRLYGELRNKKSFSSPDKVVPRLVLEAKKQLFKKEPSYIFWEKTVPITKEEYKNVPSSSAPIAPPEGRDSTWVKKVQEEVAKRGRSALTKDELEKISKYYREKLGR